MYGYDRNTGVKASLNDRVEFCHLGGDPLEGLTGTVGGWGDYIGLTALVVLDEAYTDGRTVVSMPVVCLKLV